MVLTRHMKPKIFTDEIISTLDNDDVLSGKSFEIQILINFFGTKFFQLMVYD